MVRDRLDAHKNQKLVECIDAPMSPIGKKKETIYIVCTEHANHLRKITEKHSRNFENCHKILKKKTTASSDHNMSTMPTTCDSAPNEKQNGAKVITDNTCDSFEVPNVTKTTTASTCSKRRKMFDSGDLTYMECMSHITECKKKSKEVVKITIQEEKKSIGKMNINKNLEQKCVLDSSIRNKFVKTTYAYKKREFDASVENKIRKKKEKQKHQYVYKKLVGTDLIKMKDSSISVDFDLKKFTANVKHMLDESYQAVRGKACSKIENKIKKERQHKKSLYASRKLRTNQKTSEFYTNIDFNKYLLNEQLNDENIVPEGALDIEAPHVPQKKRIKVLPNVLLQKTTKNR